MNVCKNLRTSTEKFCTKCGTELNDNNCNEYDINSSKYICTKCLKQYNEQKYLSDKKRIRQRQKEYELQNKLKVIKNYGGKCMCCGEDKIEFLTIDHINNNGVEERKNTKQVTGGKLYRWLIKNGYPKNNYQLLCYNCNYAKEFFGYCPHTK